MSQINYLFGVAASIHYKGNNYYSIYVGICDDKNQCYDQICYEDIVIERRYLDDPELGYTIWQITNEGRIKLFHTKLQDEKIIVSRPIKKQIRYLFKLIKKDLLEQFHKHIQQY